MLISREDFKTSKTYRAAQGIAGHFNCSSTNYDFNMLDCLQQVSVEDLVSSASVDAPSGLAEEDDSTAWFPFVDMHSRDPVLPIDSLTAMKNGYFNHVPIMTGKLVLILRTYFIRVLNILIKTLDSWGFLVPPSQKYQLINDTRPPFAINSTCKCEREPIYNLLVGIMYVYVRVDLHFRTYQYC